METKRLKVLVACEESQAVTKEFRKLGHDAFSCDLKECSGGHPEWHIQGDAIETMNSQKWDLVIAHPVCTRLANSGVLRLYKGGKKSNGIDEQKWQDMLNARKFFMSFYDYDGVIAIENPVQHKHANIPRYNQTIHPYHFGNPESKRTCLWLKGLPLLKHTNVLPLPESGRWDNQTKDGQNKLIVDGKWIGYNDPRTATFRSKTYKGIAKAMAEQWSDYLLKSKS